MEAWDRAKVVQEEVNGEIIVNGNGAGRAKTKLMEMVVKRVMEAWDKAKVVVEEERAKMVVGEEVDREARAKGTRARGKVIKEKVAWGKAKGKMTKARVRAKPGAGARAAPRGIRVAKEKIRVTQRGLKQCQNLEAPVGRPSRKWKKKWLQSSMSSTCRSWKSSGSRPCKVSCRPQGNKNCSKHSKIFSGRLNC